MPNLKFDTKWADDESEEMPEIPWLKTKVATKWGTLDRSELDPVKFLEPLDRATDFYLGHLWTHYVSVCIVKSVEDRLLTSALKPLDKATEIYLEHYWSERVKETKDA
jgi:hypothetical protein